MTTKTARSTMFHVAPATARYLIKRQGLLPEGENVTRLYPNSPPGVYFWGDIVHAENWADEVSMMENVTQDIYEVDVSDLPIKQDAVWFNEDHDAPSRRAAWYYPGPVPVDRVRLIDTFRAGRTSNIFDPIEKALDQKVFDVIEPRKKHIDFILRLYQRALKHELGIEGDGWVDLYLTGSLTTYQYSETSDADVSVFANWDRFYQELGLDAKEARKLLIALSIDHIDGTFLPGTTHPLQFFVVPQGTLPSDLYQPGLRSAYSLDDRMWYQEPEPDRVHDIQTELPEFFTRASDIAEKMTEMLDHDPETARTLWHDVHKKRQLDQQAGLGDFCEGNIVYKYLLHEGLFDRIRNELGEYIAKWKLSTPPAGEAPAFLDEYDKTLPPIIPGMAEGQVRGYDWEVDIDAFETLYEMKNWAAPKIELSIITPDDKDAWTRLLGWHSHRNGKHVIKLHPFQRGSTANKTLWHEIQHAYQEEEGRNDRTNYQWLNPSEPGQYEKHPIEIDAEEFAQFMQKVPLIKHAPFNNNPKWVPNELHLDRGEWNEDSELWELTPEQLVTELSAQVQMFRADRDEWAGTWMDADEYDQYMGYGKRAGDTGHLWEKVNTKVIYDFENDNIILGTQALATDLPDTKIIGEYDGESVTLFEAEKQWINPDYFHRLWSHTFPNRPLHGVYYKRGDGSQYKLKTRPRKAMAERTGDPELDRLIERFMKEEYDYLCGGGEYETPDLRIPENAAGECTHVSEFFAGWLQQQGIDAQVSGDRMVNNELIEDYLSPEDFGYTDRAIPGYDMHTAVIVWKDGYEYMIDFTAAQYGYTEFPMVQRLKDNTWQREFE